MFVILAAHIVFTAGLCQLGMFFGHCVSHRARGGGNICQVVEENCGFGIVMIAEAPQN